MTCDDCKMGIQLLSTSCWKREQSPQSWTRLLLRSARITPQRNAQLLSMLSSRRDFLCLLRLLMRQDSDRLAKLLCPAPVPQGSTGSSELKQHQQECSLT